MDMVELDWLEYRRPLLFQPWYPLIPNRKNRPSINEEFKFKLFGDEIERVSLKTRSLLCQEEAFDTWSACEVLSGRIRNSFLETDVAMNSVTYLSELEDVHIILPHGIIWSEKKNEMYWECSMHGNVRASYLFMQSELTNWSVIKSKWMPAPNKVSEPVFWAYEPQYTNYYHFLVDNYWKLFKLNRYQKEGFVPPGIPYYSAPTKNSTYIKDLISIANLGGNRHLYFPHGHRRASS
jgi:hypothetical protein